MARGDAGPGWCGSSSFRCLPTTFPFIKSSPVLGALIASVRFQLGYRIHQHESNPLRVLALDCSVFALARFLAAGSALAFALSLAPAAYAVDLFGASVVIPGHSFTATSSNVVNLISDMTHGTGQFAPVSGNAYKAGITYFGVPAAMQFTSNAAGTKITISSKITGLHQTSPAPRAATSPTRW